MSHFCSRLKPDSYSHLKGESKSHLKLSDSHSRTSDSHSKPLNSHSKSSDPHSDRKHAHQSGTPNKHHHRDHRRGNVSNSDHRSGVSAHRSSSHDKRPTDHGTGKDKELHHHHQHKASRTPQKLSTGSDDLSTQCYTHSVVHCAQVVNQCVHQSFRKGVFLVAHQ